MGPVIQFTKIWNATVLTKDSSKQLFHYIHAAAKSLQSCPSLCDPIDGSSPGSPCPWDSPGKNTGVGWHFLLQCMKVKSESEVAQSSLTLRDPMDCSPPGSSIHGIFPARVLEWVAIAFSATLSTSVTYTHNLHSPNCFHQCFLLDDLMDVK